MCLRFGVLGIYVYICASNNIVSVRVSFLFRVYIYNWGVIAVEGIRSPQTITTYSKTFCILINNSDYKNLDKRFIICVNCQIKCASDINHVIRMSFSFIFCVYKDR